MTSAGVLDSLLQQAGGLHRQIRELLAQAAMRVSPHLRRPKHQAPMPDLDTVVLAQIERADGPTSGNAMRTLTAAASLADVVRNHSASV
jgi:hypothetical protein